MKNSLCLQLVLTLLLLPFSAKAQNQFEKVLFIGDSHAAGYFGIEVDKYLRTLSSDVTTIASCGSSPSTWLTTNANYKSTNCGYWKKDSSGHETKTNSHKVDSFTNEMMTDKPDLTVVALGTNILSSPANITHELPSIEKMLSQIEQAHSQCVWIGPPDLRQNPFKANLSSGVEQIQKLVQKYHCLFVDSTKLTHYPATTKNGIHYDSKDAAEWGKKVSAEIAENLKNLKTLSASAKPNPSQKSTTAQ